MSRVVTVAAIALLALSIVSCGVLATPVTTVMKWSQPAYQIGHDPTGLPIYWGWDEPSWSLGVPPGGPQAADDWRCRDQLPVTDFHWWGSYLGSLNPNPQITPIAFWFGIYTDIPAQSGGVGYSMPGDLIWQYTSTTYEEKFVGWDVIDPASPPHDATFQYNVYLPRTNWFYQPGADKILWLSIVAIYQPTGPLQEWGWKSRPHFFQDDAVSRYTGTAWRPLVGPDGLSWDLSFEISTVPEPGSLAALAAGLIGLVGLTGRRKK